MNGPLHHPGADTRCAACAGRGFVVRPDGERAVAAACDCVTACPQCDDTGWVNRDGGTVRCLCAHVLRRRRLFDRVAIPARHADSTLASYAITNPDQASAGGTVHTWLLGYRVGQPNRGLVLSGLFGVGKTHLLCGMLADLVLNFDVSARFVEFSHLVTDFKASFERGSGAAGLLDSLVDVDVLGIDELGKGRLTEFEDTLLDEVISRRYNANGTILGTSNYAPGDARGERHANLTHRGRDTPALADRVGPRVYSRLRQMCDFHVVGGRDYRDRGRQRIPGTR